MTTRSPCHGPSTTSARAPCTRKRPPKGSRVASIRARYSAISGPSPPSRGGRRRRSRTRSLLRDPVEEAADPVEAAVPVGDGHVGADHRRLLALRTQAPGEPHLVVVGVDRPGEPEDPARELLVHRDRKSTRLNSSHANISYAVFCLKKKKNLAHRLTSVRADCEGQITSE